MQQEIENIIARALSGNASADDLIALSEWLAEGEENRMEFRKLKVFWNAKVSYLEDASPELAYERLQRHFQERRWRRRRMSLLAVSAAAAAVLLFLFAPGFKGKDSAAVKRQVYTYISGAQKTELALEDGTVVVLGKGSRLTYDDDFGEKERRVLLDGTAYFKVTKSAKQKFIVQIGGAAIEVLGTTFSVDADPRSGNVTATLVEGSIRFHTPEQQVRLLPNQQLAYWCRMNRIDIRAVDVEEATAWKDNLIKYKSISFVRLLEELGERYHSKIEIENPQLRQPSVQVSGSFSEEQSLDEILQVVSKSLPIHWNCRGDTIYIR